MTWEYKLGTYTLIWVWIDISRFHYISQWYFFTISQSSCWTIIHFSPRVGHLPLIPRVWKPQYKISVSDLFSWPWIWFSRGSLWHNTYVDFRYDIPVSNNMILMLAMVWHCNCALRFAVFLLLLFSVLEPRVWCLEIYNLRYNVYTCGFPCLDYFARRTYARVVNF